MGVLADYLSAEADQLRAELSKQKAAYESWRASVTGLYSQLAQWLQQADGGRQVVDVNVHGLTWVTDPALGQIMIEQMLVMIGDRRVFIVPKARYVAATIRPPGKEAKRADGMVEIRDGQIPEYYLFRWATDAGDEWFIRNVDAWNADPEYGRVDPLDRDHFEAAILSLLR